MFPYGTLSNEEFVELDEGPDSSLVGGWPASLEAKGGGGVKYFG